GAAAARRGPDRGRGLALGLVGLAPGTLTFDCADPARVSAVWAESFGSDRQLDEDEPSAYLADPTARTLGIFFQAVPEPKAGKNRVHLDVRPATRMQDEVERLRTLGAAPIREVRERATWTVMGDVEGNELCVLQG